MNRVDWEQHRRPDGSIDLLSAFKAWVGQDTFDKWPATAMSCVMNNCRVLEELHPVKSRQAAALALVIIRQAV